MAWRSYEPRAGSLEILTFPSLFWRRTPCGSLEISRFLPSSVGKMAVFDKTELLVMSPVQHFHCCRQTDALAAGKIAKMSLQQWVRTNVVLCCCRMNMPSAGRAKFANCNAHEDKKVISKQLSKLCVPKLRRAAQGKGNCSRMTTRSCSREGAARTECRCSARRERAAQQEGAAARRSCFASSPHNQF